MSFETAFEPAIVVADIGKCYQLYDRPENRLKQALIPRAQRALGREPTRFFRESWALRGVSFSIARGETVGIIGRNGSGKSTLLQIVCGTLTPTHGNVAVSGRIGALLELGSGFNPEFTGRENVYMNGAILGMDAAEVDAKYADIVAFADIGDFIDQPVKTYSSGMYVRLAFAVIAHAEADILVIDEALSVGDVFFAQKCIRFLRDFQKRGSVLFVSHDASAIVNLCDRAIWLDGGCVAMDGSAKVVCEAYHASTYGHAPLPVRSAAEQNAVPEPIDGNVDGDELSLEASRLRVFAFDADSAGFGDGGARIEAVGFFDLDGQPVSHIAGGEVVRLRMKAVAERTLISPIIGFFIKDRLGQQIIGKHTWREDLPAATAAAGERVEAVFEFCMPHFPRGRYTVDVAVADGSHIDHVQAAWVYDVVSFESASTTVTAGLIGIPFRTVSLHVGVPEG
jgi:lipopolysaccharide transport system ATP-binding protein